MNESPTPPADLVVRRATPGGATGRWIALAALLLAALGAASLWLAWNTQQRVNELEQLLVKRQEDSGAMANAAQLLAKQAQDSARDAGAKTALLEARVAEATLQRSQLEELIQSLSRSRDENVLADVETTIRVALQHSAITGSVEPLAVALKQAEERLARQDQPRLEGVRRALVQDMERLRAAGAVDVAVLAIRLDEAVRLVDDLPLLSTPERRPMTRAPVRAATSASAATPALAPRPAASGVGAGASRPSPSAMRVPPAASAPASAAEEPGTSWSRTLGGGWVVLGTRVWDEVRSLIRVTPIEQPEAMLLAPDQAFMLRENLKLRLMNARLALLGRQFDTAQSDLRDVSMALERYFDRSSKRVLGTIELVRQVSAQAHQVVVPRPDATLAAIATVASGR